MANDGSDGLADNSPDPKVYNDNSEEGYVHDMPHNLQISKSNIVAQFCQASGVSIIRD